MKFQTKKGLFLLLLISLLPIIPWYFLSPVRTLQLNYENFTHALGQITALIGMTMFAITFVLSTRWKFIEKLLGGLDNVYVVHRIFGSSSFVLILLHPLLLVLKYIPARMDLAAKYLLPGHGFSVDLGIIALAGMIILLAMTFYINIKYNYWKMSHKFLGLFFIIAVFHIFLVRGTASRDYIFQGYYVYAFIVSAIGLFAFFYTLIFKKLKTIPYKITSIIKNNSFFDIRMIPVNKNNSLRYEPGQFAFFSFHNKDLGKESHPFSLASNSKEELRIIVKALGDYTNKLEYLESGCKVSVEGPYGEFTLKKENSSLLWIAGGIGITPFIGMTEKLVEERKKYSRRKAVLYYCARTEAELIVLKELQELEKVSEGYFKVVPWCSDKQGRISSKDIIALNPMKNAKVYLCGPKGLKESLIKQLIKQGIKKKVIFQEEFEFK